MDPSFFKQYSEKLMENQPDATFQDQDWNEISSLLPTANKRRRVFAFVIPAALIIGLAVYWAFQNPKNSLEDATPRPSQSISDIPTHPSSLSIPSTRTPVSKAAILSKPLPVFSSTLPQEANKLRSRFVSKKKGHISGMVAPDAAPSIVCLDGKSEFPKENMQMAPQVFVQETKVHKNKDAYHLPVLAKDWVQPISILNNQKRLELSQNLFVLKKPEESFIPKPTVFARGGAGIYTEKAWGHPAAEFDPNTIQENVLKPVHGRNLSLSLYLPVGKSWRFGLGYEQTRSTFTVEHKAYIPAGALKYVSSSADNIKRFEYAYDVNDGTSQSRVKVAFFEVAQNQHLNHQDTFNVNMILNRSIQNFQLPVFVERRVMHTGALGLFARMGANFLLYSHIKNDVNYHSESCAELCFYNNIIPSISSQPGYKFQISGHAGLSMEWKKSPNMILGLGPQVYITPAKTQFKGNIRYQFGAYISYGFGGSKLNLK